MLPAHIPSPSEGVLHLGPVPIRAYALCIIAGVVVATIVGQHRFEKRGGRKGAIADVATFPWINNLIGFYGAGDLVGMEKFAHVTRALGAFMARPAVVRGLGIPQRVK